MSLDSKLPLVYLSGLRFDSIEDLLLPWKRILLLAMLRSRRLDSDLQVSILTMLLKLLFDWFPLGVLQVLYSLGVFGLKVCLLLSEVRMFSLLEMLILDNFISVLVNLILLFDFDLLLETILALPYIFYRPFASCGLLQSRSRRPTSQGENKWCWSLVSLFMSN